MHPPTCGSLVNTTSTTLKQISFDDAPVFFRDLKAQGYTLVQCHGTFDLIHPGHIYHLEEAKELGDKLVVTITSESFVNKGPGRPYFNDELRVKSLTALECVDYVVVIPHPAAIEAIQCIQPDFYCKGVEYSKPENDPTQNIHDDVVTVESLGGQISYLGSVVFSSTKLINRHLNVYPQEIKDFCAKLRRHTSSDDFRKAIDSLHELKVLVIGDIIFDRYTTLQVQGLTSKNRIISGRFVEEQTQAGGALAVLKHLREFTQQVKLISIVGTETWVADALTSHIQQHEDEILRIHDYTTIVKQRFVEPQLEGKELSKLFSTNYIHPEPPNQLTQNAVIDRLDTYIEEVDLVLVMDFGHGALETIIREYIQNKAPLLALNCQTNSNNYGFNIINKRYQRADFFTLDAAELKLASGHKDIFFDHELLTLKRELSAQTAWLTRGEVETIGIDGAENRCTCPALESKVVDTIGAGDAFCALTSLAFAKKLPLDLSAFMGQLAGAHAVKVVGNAQPVQKSTFIKSGMSMLSI